MTESYDLLIRGGVCATPNGIAPADIGVKDGKIALIINTPSGKATKEDEVKIRSHAILHNVPLITTISGAQASVNGIENMMKHNKISVKPLQDYHNKATVKGAK